MVDFDDMSEESLRAAFKRKFGSNIEEEGRISVKFDQDQEHFIISGETVGMVFNYLEFKNEKEDLLLTMWDNPLYRLVLEGESDGGQILYVKKRR